jgi:EmrB/QacA subfamily drug resistance transporter
LRENKAIALVTIILGFFMALLDTTIVNIVLPKMTDDFHTTVEHISWVLNGYNLAFSVLLLTASRLADQFGRKKTFMIGIAMFTLSSYLCGIASSADWLIAFRVVQGLSAALVVPVTIPLATDLFPPEKRGAISGIWGAFAGLAAASGPTLGGILSENFHWQWVFFINVPIGVIALALAAMVLRESFDPTASKRIDWLGVLFLSIGMFAAVLALIQANDKGWTSSYILTLFSVAILSLAAFVVTEVRVKEPMLPLSLFRIMPFTMSSLTLFMMGIGMMSCVFLLAFYLTHVYGMTELQAGLTITTMPITSMVFSSISGPLSDKVGNRWFSALGMGCISLAVYLFGTLSPDTPHREIVFRLIVAGVGLGLTMAPTTVASIHAVPAEKVGMSSGITNMSRILGTVIGVAVLVAVLNVHLTDNVKSAKNAAVSMIHADTVLNSESKSMFVSRLETASVSRDSKGFGADTVISQLRTREQNVLNHASSQAQPAIKAEFQRTESELKMLLPKIQSTFQSSISTAFNDTFKFGSIMMLVGIVFGFLSDPRKMKRIKEKSSVSFSGVE